MKTGRFQADVASIDEEVERAVPDSELPSVSMTWTMCEIESFAKLASEEQPNLRHNSFEQ